jgi:hypothetical protein
MKILLVHADSFKWATTIRAEALKKEWVNDDVDIVHYKDLPDGTDYDVIHFLYSGGINKCSDYILKNKYKVFTTLASYRTLDLYFDKLEPLIEIYRNTVCCVCHNEGLGDMLVRLIGQYNVVCIPNGVDVSMFNRKFVVGCVGAKQDKFDYKGFNLVKQACKELGLELLIANTKQHSEMPDFYNTIDCLVIASKEEGCNNPTLEALAMNKPVISTRVGNAYEFDGVTLIERDVASIKNALRKLSGRLQILEQYTWPIIAKKYHRLYEGREKV